MPSKLNWASDGGGEGWLFGLGGGGGDGGSLIILAKRWPFGIGGGGGDGGSLIILAPLAETTIVGHNAS